MEAEFIEIAASFHADLPALHDLLERIGNCEQLRHEPQLALLWAPRMSQIERISD
jgi:hypothetical protein